MLTPVRRTRKIGFYDGSFRQSKDCSSSHRVKFSSFSKSYINKLIVEVS